MKNEFRVLRIAPRIFLYDSNSSAPKLKEGEVAFAQVPSTAFGDGTHPTTRLCAGAVDQLCRLFRPKSVLDVGTGTGVLARIARSRGAQFIAGTDIDADALIAARANSSLDSSESEILFENCPPDHWGPRFDLVIANILEEPLLDLAPQLSRALAPGGRLLVSGFTPLQVPHISVRFKTAGLKSETTSVQDGWAVMIFRSGADLANSHRLTDF